MASELTAAVLAELRKSVGAVSVRLQTLMFAKHLKGDGGGIMQHLGDDRVRCVCVIDDAALGKALVELWTHAPALIAAAERAEEHRQEIHDLTWNLAGCDTIATSGKPQEFSQELARPALHAVKKRVRELEEALEEIMPRYCELYEAAGLGNPQESVAVDIARTALGKEPRT